MVAVSTRSHAKAAGDVGPANSVCGQVSTRSHAKAAGAGSMSKPNKFQVSTRSHAKAAGYFIYVGGAEMINFNSQPREGGWPISSQTEKAV